ncbi:MAG: T9SS type A sorting domain-containing protein [Fibrobacteria bacterium]|nr:T9SS type A sorting domain-containing protein [Fibrobacteria bacterium]
MNPQMTVLYQNVPNPFNPVTVIKYDLKDRAKVSIKVYNIKGQLLTELVKPNKYLSPGRYQIIWDGKDRNGIELPSGHYLYYMTTKGYRKAKKMSIIK